MKKFNIRMTAVLMSLVLFCLSFPITTLAAFMPKFIVTSATTVKNSDFTVTIKAENAKDIQGATLLIKLPPDFDIAEGNAFKPLLKDAYVEGGYAIKRLDGNYVSCVFVFSDVAQDANFDIASITLHAGDVANAEYELVLIVENYIYQNSIKTDSKIPINGKANIISANDEIKFTVSAEGVATDFYREYLDPDYNVIQDFNYQPETLVVPDNVKTLGSTLFDNNRAAKLKTLLLPKTVTAIDNIAVQALRNSVNLTNINIADNGSYFTESGVLYGSKSGDTSVAIYPKGLKNRSFSPSSRLTNINASNPINDADILTLNLGDNVANIQNVETAFSKTLATINVANCNTVYSSISGVLLSKNGKTLFAVPYAKSSAFSLSNNVTTVKANAFIGNKTIIITVNNKDTKFELNSVKGKNYTFKVYRNGQAYTSLKNLGAKITTFMPTATNVDAFCPLLQQDCTMYVNYNTYTVKSVVISGKTIDAKYYTATPNATDYKGKGTLKLSYEVLTKEFAGDYGKKTITIKFNEGPEIKPTITTTEKHTCSFSAWEVTKVPTCSAVGEQKRTCKYCQKVETTEIPKNADNHKYGEYFVTIEPSCSNVGKAERTCAWCKKTESIEIPAHLFYWKTASPGIQRKYCATEGEGRNKSFETKYGSEHKHSGTQYTATLKATEHTNGATYTWYSGCKCNTKTVIAHTCNGTETITKNQIAATCTLEGYSGDTYCTMCNTIINKGSKIAALGHTGGIATCNALAICDTCKTAYGEFNKNVHAGGTYTLGKVEATKEQDGYSGDTYCKGCDALLEKGTVIPKLETPTETPTEKPTEKPTDKPIENPTDKPIETKPDEELVIPVDSLVKKDEETKDEKGNEIVYAIYYGEFTVGDFKKANPGYEIKVVDSDGLYLTDDVVLGTDCTNSVYLNGELVKTYVTVLLGDFNGDGKVKTSDARNALRCALNLDTATPAQLLAIEISGDGKVKTSDARIILRIALGLENVAEFLK
ncbi:MAG TPA: hypothetical protein GXZ23_04660 [Clostridiales bacterium]|nr:hypothetical protein [Clostridiales bacterium]